MTDKLSPHKGPNFVTELNDIWDSSNFKVYFSDHCSSDHCYRLDLEIKNKIVRNKYCKGSEIN